MAVFPTQHLVMIGGGHSHAIVLKQFSRHPLAGVRLTLITDVLHTPYSGMLPGYVAGLYRFHDCHIDLQALSQLAQVELIHDRAIGLDLDRRQVLLAQHAAIAFDRVSIDIGSTPATSTVPGAAKYTTPVKPIAQFLAQWDQLVATITNLESATAPLRLAIVGGGAGGVELAFSMQARLQPLLRQPLDLHLIHRGDRLLPTHSPGLSRRIEHLLRQRGIQIHLRQTVTAITSEGDRGAALPFTSPATLYAQSDTPSTGLVLPCDRIVWVTQAAAAPWLQYSGLATDPHGFIWVNDRLQSVSHPDIFAAGDIATMVNHPRPKAGVFAVRQGLPLYRNLRRSLQGQALASFIPQREVLSLIGTGDRRALAARSGINLGPSPWLWWWKDRIDRRFMIQFSPAASSPQV